MIPSLAMPPQPVEIMTRPPLEHEGLWIDSRLAETQKICDFNDWQDPGIDSIIHKHLRSIPNHQRRQWEFAVILLSLARAGALRPGAEAISFGSGTEILIYTISQLVKKVTVTDLYNMSSRWVGVRTADPRQHILDSARFPIDESKIEARDMDMRNIDFPDQSFNFCWSTGSFEHIGGDADFIRHLCEVHRALKPGGVYSFTTVVAYEPGGSRIPHNHYFGFEHLLDLIDASPLRPHPVLDCRLTPGRFNQPIHDSLEDFGLNVGNRFTPVVTLLRRGVVTSAINLVLHKRDDLPKVRPELRGLEQTRDYLGRSLRMITSKMWKGWQYLSPLAGITSAKQPCGEGAVNTRGQYVFRTQPQYFGAGAVRARMRLDATALDESGAGIRVSIVEQNRVWPLEKKVVCGESIDVIKDGGGRVVELAFIADERKCYTVQGRVNHGSAAYGAATVFATKDKDTSRSTPD